MKTPAIIASLTVAGSIAFAAGQQSGGKPSPPMPSVAQVHVMEDKEPAMRMTMANVCPEPQVITLPWFGPVRDLPACTRFLWDGGNYRTGIADVNGDGIQEFFDLGTNDLRTNGTDAAESTMILGKIAFNPKDASEVQVLPVITAGNLASWVAAQDFGCTDISVRCLGWFDADGDGDLDYGIEIYLGGSACGGVKRVWLENIGFEKAAPPFAADLNRDGQVDGADLGMLLLAWGPNP